MKWRAARNIVDFGGEEDRWSNCVIMAIANAKRPWIKAGSGKVSCGRLFEMDVVAREQVTRSVGLI
jgi:hypothetical protein